MTKKRRKPQRRKPRIITYRTQPEDERYFHDMAERLIGKQVVIYMPQYERYQRGYLTAVGDFGEDKFRVKWTQKGLGRTLKGLWRVHNAGLFGGGKYPQKRGKPTPADACITPRNGVASTPAPNNKAQRRAKGMAKATSKTKTKTAAKRGRPSQLDDLTPAQREKLANRVRRLREQGIGWDSEGGIVDQIPEVSSATMGRKLLAEAGAEDLIRPTGRENGSSKKSSAKKAGGKAAAKSGAKKSTAKAPAKKTGRKVVVRRGSGRSKDPS